MKDKMMILGAFPTWPGLDRSEELRRMREASMEQAKNRLNRMEEEKRMARRSSVALAARS